MRRNGSGRLKPQDVRRKANAVFVLVETAAPTTIVGYFALCATALEPGAIPEAPGRRLPRYPLVSATLIGCLATAKERQGEGLGAALLALALDAARLGAESVGASVAVVDAVEEQTAGFYAAHGFARLEDSMRLLPGVLELAGHVQIGVHPRLHHLEGAQLGELAGVGVEGEGVQHFKR